LICASAAFPQQLSRSFELRYFSSDAKANGETDFKGPTAVFTTEDRLRYLQAYARYARNFYNDPKWNKLVVSDAEATQVLQAIKPRPLPAVRKRIPLDEWKWTGSRPGQREERVQRLAEWQKTPGVQLAGGELHYTGSAPLNWTFKPQPWRMSLQWRARVPAANLHAGFLLSDVVETGFAGDGTLYYRTGSGEVAAGRYRAGQWVEFKVEIDQESKSYNLYIDGDLRADFVPVLKDGPVNALRVNGVKGLAIDDVWGVGYLSNVKDDDIHSRDVPYSIATFVTRITSRRCGPAAAAPMAWTPAPIATTIRPSSTCAQASRAAGAWCRTRNCWSATS
jgi:hypothetical protein